MKSNIFIPKTINVGYQNRSGTYTGKLAYVIYYDEKGKLRKEASWNSWRDEKIPNEEFDNVPTTGFVLNKKVGDYSSGWDHRQAYCRVYDPRNFEFEITIENLLYILENANSIKGKGLEGEFVYGWDGKDLVLMPIESPDYKQISEYNRVIHNNETIKAKDLIVGATYLTKDNSEYVYMGRFDKYENCYWKNGHSFKTRKKMEKWCEENNIPKTPSNKRYYSWERYEEDKYEPDSVGKQYCFYYKRKNYNDEFVDDFCWMSSTGKTLIAVLNEKCREDYSNLFYLLEGTDSYSPIDKSKEKYFPMSFEEFFNKAIFRYKDNTIGYNNIRFMGTGKSNIEKFEIRQPYQQKNKGKYVLYKYSKGGTYNGDIEVVDIFPTEEREEKGYWGKRVERRMIPVGLEEIFETLRPVYKQIYLKNGREYKKEYTL